MVYKLWNTFRSLAIAGDNRAFVFGVSRYQETFSVVVNGFNDIAYKKDEM